MGYKKIPELGITHSQYLVLQVVERLGETSPKQIHDAEEVSIGLTMIQRHLKALTLKGLIKKIGTPPKVFYKTVKHEKLNPLSSRVMQLPTEQSAADILERFFAFSTDIDLLTGEKAFKAWYISSQLPDLQKHKSKTKSLALRVEENYDKLLNQYITHRNDIENMRSKNHLLDGTSRYKSIFEQAFVDKVFYADFYSLPQFGKTKLGHFVQRAKIGEVMSKKYIKKINRTMRLALEKIDAKKRLDAVIWVPHSLTRKIPLMDTLQSENKNLYPTIEVVKVFEHEIIPQKTISDLNLRLNNALATNIVNLSQVLPSFKHICIVDDAIGSGATIHAIASKIKKKIPNVYISALAPIGSYKGFDVIKDI